MDDDDIKNDDNLDKIDDNNDLLADNNPLSSTMINNEELMLNESNDTGLSGNDSRDVSFQSNINARSMPKCIKDVHLDSATATIHRLENEIKKLQTDGQHWRRLAKEVSFFPNLIYLETICLNENLFRLNLKMNNYFRVVKGHLSYYYFCQLSV